MSASEQELNLRQSTSKRENLAKPIEPTTKKRICSPETEGKGIDSLRLLEELSAVQKHQTFQVKQILSL